MYTQTFIAILMCFGVLTVRTVPPIFPEEGEERVINDEFKQKCVGMFKDRTIAKKFREVKSYVSVSSDFGIIVRLELEDINGNGGNFVNRFMCWKDKESGDIMTALSLGNKGRLLPD